MPAKKSDEMTYPTDNPRINSAWITGPIVLSGNWEPLIFRRRVNLGSANVADLYLREHTPALTKRLRALGVNLLITHYFKGFGLRAEEEDIRCAEKLVVLCHECGIRVGGYVGDTIILETMLAEEPLAESWIQRRADGMPVTYGWTQTFRYKWCRTNPAFIAYMKIVLSRAVASGLDLIHFDNYTNKPEPDSCHCRWCQEGFRSFLIERYDEEQRRARLGFADVSHLRPPTFSQPLYASWNNDVIVNPLLQEWIVFKCHINTLRYREMADFCRKLNSDIAIEANPGGIWGENSAYMRSVDHAGLLPHGDFFWDESPHPYGLQENGALSTNIRSAKMGQATGNRMFYYCRSDLHAAEGLAFNGGCLGMVASINGDSAEPCWPGRADYVRLLEQRPGAFCGTRSMADVAVYRNFPSLSGNGLEPHLQTILVEEALLECHIPFDLVFDLDHLRHRVLILPGTECLSPADLDRLSVYVKGGGGLLVVGMAGVYDEWRRAYPENHFDRLFSGNDAIVLGKGKMVRIPMMELPPEAPSLEKRVVQDDWYRVIDVKYWILPGNAGRLISVLTGKEFGISPPVVVNAPRTTVVEPRRSADGGTLYVHVINYGTAGGILDFSVPGVFDSVVLAAPGCDDVSLPVKFNEGRMCFMADTGRPYSLLIVTRQNHPRSRTGVFICETMAQ